MLPNKSILLSVLFLSVVFFSNIAHADNKPSKDFRPCTQSDLIGTWDVISLQSPTPIDKNNPYFFRYQRFVFQKDGKVRHMTTTEPITEDWFQMMLLAPATSTFRVDQEGVMTIQKKAAPSEHALCTYNLLDVRSPDNQPVFMNGDILLTTKIDGKIVLQRNLRKVGSGTA